MSSQGPKSAHDRHMLPVACAHKGVVVEKSGKVPQRWRGAQPRGLYTRRFNRLTPSINLGACRSPRLAGGRFALWFTAVAGRMQFPTEAGEGGFRASQWQGLYRYGSIDPKVQVPQVVDARWLQQEGGNW